MYVRPAVLSTLLFVLTFPRIVQAQLFKNNPLIDKVKNAASGIDNSSWKPGAAITTSIKDSLPAFRIFNDGDFDFHDADSFTSFQLKPGYYRATIRSYCLHAGAYGSSKGDGYQIARLKGNQASLIDSILVRSAAHPEIVQSDVQMLIWGIEAGQKSTDYAADYQRRIKPLLTDKDIARMQVKISQLTEKLLPEDLKEMANTYASIRNRMDKAQMNYDDIEKVAVKTGIPPTGLGSVEIKKGLWSYIGNGFFIRAYPEMYTTTDIEIYRPGSFVVEKDDKGRITAFTRGSQSVHIEYDDSPGADMAANPGHPSIPVWRFKRFTYTDTEKGTNEEVRDKGWILRGKPDELINLFASASPSNASPAASSKTSAAGAKHGGPFYIPTAGAKHGGPFYFPGADDLAYNGRTSAPGAEAAAAPDPQQKKSIDWDALYSRYQELKSDYSNAKEAVNWSRRLDNADKLQDYDEYLNEKAADDMIAKGLKAASNPTDFKGKSDWLYDLLKMDRDLMYWITCSLAGSCNDNNNPATPDLPSKVAQPGNSGAQRLGLSPIRKLPLYHP